MRNKICTALLAAALLLSLLSACAVNSPLASSLQQQNPAGSPMRGSWDGLVFTNEYLGLTFTRPIFWGPASDEEIAELMGLGLEILEAETDMDIDIDTIMEMANILVFHDMMTANPFTGASVQILFERLPFPANRLSTPEYIELAAENIAVTGMEVNLDFPGTTRIGNYYWYSFQTPMEVLGENVYVRHFVTVQNGFARTIIIIYSEETESLEEILAMFS